MIAKAINEVMKMRNLQIGVMGSAADLNYSKKLEEIAEEIGYEIGKRQGILLFGAEKDYDSLSTAACRGAKKAGGLTVGITYGKGKDIYEENADVIISTGAERGGPRESVLALSCDGLIAISGGSGTLTEMAIAYQANIPIVAMKGTGGWADKLAGCYLDARNRVQVYPANTPVEAVAKIYKMVEEGLR
jgi:uncharacterized protein (TIGR00725 family)